MSEATFQAGIIRWLKAKGCVVMKIPAGYASIPTGFPDILALLDGGGWICLEVKASPKASYRPLQKEWIKRLDAMFYCRAVDPTNWDEIKKEIEQII